MLKIKLKNHPQRDKIVTEMRNMWDEFCGGYVELPFGRFNLTMKSVREEIIREYKDLQISMSMVASILRNEYYIDREYIPPQKTNKNRGTLL